MCRLYVHRFVSSTLCIHAMYEMDFVCELSVMTMLDVMYGPCDVMNEQWTMCLFNCWDVQKKKLYAECNLLWYSAYMTRGGNLLCLGWPTDPKPSAILSRHSVYTSFFV